METYYVHLNVRVHSFLLLIINCNVSILQIVLRLCYILAKINAFPVVLQLDLVMFRQIASAQRYVRNFWTKMVIIVFRNVKISFIK